MNVLSRERQTQIVSALVEGNSVRATARMVGIEHNTVLRVLARVGERCAHILNERMRQLPCKIVQVDEIWTYVAKHEKRIQPEDNRRKVGDQYLFVAIDSESKLIPAFMVGKRDGYTAWNFVQDLKSRLKDRVQLTTDGFQPYIRAVDDAFGYDVDYAMLIKTYKEDPKTQERRYSPGQIVNAVPIPVYGNPKSALISTSHIERQNLTIRMQLRRFARLTNAFSKKLENLKAACALHFAWYNFCRIHSTLRVTPAMQVGISNEIWPLSALIGAS